MSSRTVPRSLLCVWLAAFALGACKSRPQERPAPTTKFAIGQELQEKPLPSAVEGKLKALREDATVRSELDHDTLNTESPFHRASRELLLGASPDLLEALASDKAPVVRALAYRGYALKGDAERLAQHFCDRSVVLLCPGGCVCGHDSLGEVAQRMAFRPDWLQLMTKDSPLAYQPLFDAAATRRLQVQVLAVDGCRLFFEARPFDGADLEHQTFRDLHAMAPNVPEWMLVKAVARREPERARALLVKVLEDANLSTPARLAAASGLTLTPDNDAALTRNAAFLNQVDDASRFIEEAELRKHYVTLKAAIRKRYDDLYAAAMADPAAPEGELPTDQEIELLEIEHAMVLEDAFDEPSHGGRYSEAFEARRDALWWISRTFDDHEACWDAYRDAPYVLERWLQGDYEQGVLERLDEDDRDSLRERVREATERRDADTRCR